MPVAAGRGSSLAEFVLRGHRSGAGASLLRSEENGLPSVLREPPVLGEFRLPGPASRSQRVGAAVAGVAGGVGRQLGALLTPVPGSALPYPGTNHLFSL